MFDVIIETTIDSLALELGLEYHFVVYVTNKGTKRSLSIIPELDVLIDQIDTSICHSNETEVCIGDKQPRAQIKLDVEERVSFTVFITCNIALESEPGHRLNIYAEDEANTRVGTTGISITTL